MRGRFVFRTDRPCDRWVHLLNDVFVTSWARPAAVADAVVAFFAEHKVASLRLPSGWFGRPHDNWHQLTDVAIDGGEDAIRLDGRQVLTLDAERSWAEGLVLRITVRGGRWHWIDYGGNHEHDEVVGAGIVEFHAPSHR